MRMKIKLPKLQTIQFFDHVYESYTYIKNNRPHIRIYCDISNQLDCYYMNKFRTAQFLRNRPYSSVIVHQVCEMYMRMTCRVKLNIKTK